MYIRADGNSKIGMGHIMRCISIGKEVQDLGEEVIFLTADEEPVALLEEQGFQVLVLHTDYRMMDVEWETLEPLLPRGSKLLVDSYFVTDEYLNKLRTRTKVIYVDDVNAFDYPVDCIINGNIYGADTEYHAPLVLGGCKYAPLRREYAQYRGKRTEEYVLITTGSSDPYSITLKLLKEAVTRPELMKWPFRVVCGRFNGDYEEIKAMEETYPNIRVLQNVPDMWNVMAGVAAAVTAGGTTMNELSCMGVPMICFSFVDNQEQIAETFYKKGFVHFRGDYLQEGNAMIDGICTALEELLEAENLRKQYSEKVSALVDGLGSRRIAEAIVTM